MRRLPTVLLATLAVAAQVSPLAAAESRMLVLGTGAVTGVYYPVGGAICRLVNQDRQTHGLRCAVDSTGGSVDNANGLAAGSLDFGIVQSDTLYAAVRGETPFDRKGQNAKLRTVMALHPEPVTIIARADAGVKGIVDLKGKRVNIGNPGSGTRSTWEVIEKALGWKRGDLRFAGDLPFSEMGQALCEGGIDAYIAIVGHPSALAQETLASCDAQLVEAAAPEIDRLIAERPYYRRTVIAKTLYDTGADIRTFGVGAVLAASADTPADAVHAAAKAVLANTEQFRRLHSVLEPLNAQEMIPGALLAPLHEGALKAYRELGLLK